MDKYSLLKSPVTSSLIEDDYSIISSQLSGSGESEGVDENGGGDVDDVLNLHNVLREESDALPDKYDLDKITMVGESRGGMMTYLALCKNPEWLKAAVAMSAPSDIRRLIADRPEVGELLSGTFTLNDRELDKRSAVSRTEEFPQDVPLLIVHGENDDRVSVDDAYDMHKKLDEAGADCELKIIKGEGHFIGRDQDTLQYINDWVSKST